MYDKNIRYLMHCPRCGKSVIWDDNPLYREIHDRRLEYNILLSKMAQFSKAEKRKNPRWRALNERLLQLRQDLSGLKSIRMSNAQYDRERWHNAFRETVLEEIGPERYAALVEKTNLKTQPETVEQMTWNKKEV